MSMSSMYRRPSLSTLLSGATALSRSADLTIPDLKTFKITCSFAAMYHILVATQSNTNLKIINKRTRLLNKQF